MPRFDTATDLEQHNLPTSHYGYSAVRMEDLGATEYTLVTLLCDVSVSVAEFKEDLEKCLKEIVKSCKKSPRADNLMIRLIQFNENFYETHGFKLLEQCDLDDYNDCLNVGGWTAAYDATHNAVEATGDFACQLIDQEYTTAVNGVMFILTDGLDNRSKQTPTTIKNAQQKVLQEEKLTEKLITILVGVNVGHPDISAKLSKFKDEAGLTQYEEIANANEKTLAKLAQFVSKSISSVSKSLQTGTASKPISLNV